jgi:hypothetical protein
MIDLGDRPVACRQALNDGDKESEGNCDRHGMLEHASRRPDESALSAAAITDSSYIAFSLKVSDSNI